MGFNTVFLGPIPMEFPFSVLVAYVLQIPTAEKLGAVANFVFQSRSNLFSPDVMNPLILIKHLKETLQLEVQYKPWDGEV